MGQHKCKGTYQEPIIAPVADYNVTSIEPIDPDCRCNYFYAGEHSGKPYYRRIDGQYFIWSFEGTESWYISQIIQDPLPEIYWGRFPGILGEYLPSAHAHGNVIVSAGEH